MTDYLDAAAQHLGVKRSKIVEHTVTGDELGVLVDYGIGGIKEYHLSLETLTAMPVDEGDVEPAAPPASELTLAGEIVGYPIEEVAEEAEVPHLADKLREAGFAWSREIIEAEEDELTAISGIGKATARKLKDAAAALEAGVSAND